MLLEYKIDLIKAFIQVEGEIKLNSTCYNYDSNDGIQFSGYKNDRLVNYTMDKTQIETLKDDEDIINIYESYKIMEYFNTL